MSWFAVQDIAEAAGKPVVMIDNAIWLLCARSGLYLTNPEFAQLARESGIPNERVDSLDALIHSWADARDGGEQRKTVDCLVDGLDRERLSARKLCPEEYKGQSWRAAPLYWTAAPSA